LKYGNAYQSQLISNKNSLFGMSNDIMIQEPPMPEAETWGLIERLNREKEITGIYISGHPLDDYRMEVKNFTTCSLNKLDNYNGQKVKIAGFVTSAQHRITKKGTGFGIFSIQDFTSSKELALFGEDYLNFKNYFVEGQALHITAQSKKSWRNQSEYDLKLKEIKLLAEVGASMTESITIKLDIRKLTSQLINDIDVVCKNHVGPHQLKMMILDHKEKVKLQLRAKTRKVNVDNDFTEELKRIGVEYTVN